MVKIVLTGGPCAGKTSVINALKEYYKSLIIVVEEAATLILGEGFPKPDKWTPEWQNKFQPLVNERQEQEEDKAYSRAIISGCKIIACDRGRMDGAAYMERGKQEFLDVFSINEQEALSCYDVVVHLESLSTLNPALFEKLLSTNPHRYEDLELAQKREFALREAWENHHDRHFVSGSIEENIAKVIEIIDAYVR